MKFNKANDSDLVKPFYSSHKLMTNTVEKGSYSFFQVEKSVVWIFSPFILNFAGFYI